MKGKTVTTFLFGEDLEGIKYAFTRNSTCKMYVIPRDKFQRDRTQPKEDFKNKIEIRLKPTIKWRKRKNLRARW